MSAAEETTSAHPEATFELPCSPSPEISVVLGTTTEDFIQDVAGEDSLDYSLVTPDYTAALATGAPHLYPDGSSNSQNVCHRLHDDKCSRRLRNKIARLYEP
jgi:hypothetical protein